MEYLTVSSGPQPFQHQGPVSWKTVFQGMGGGDGAGGHASGGEPQMKLRLLARCSPPAVRPSS